MTALCDGVWLSAAVGLSKPDPAFFARRSMRGRWLRPASPTSATARTTTSLPAKTLGLSTVRLSRGPHVDQPARSDAERADVEAGI